MSNLEELGSGNLRQRKRQGHCNMRNRKRLGLCQNKINELNLQDILCKDELAVIKNQKQILETKLEAINQRIAEIEKE